MVLGSEYPFALGTDDPRGALAAAGLPEDLEGRLLRDNALAFLGVA